MPVADKMTLVSDWVTQYPQTAVLFEELHIDYCCGGCIPLSVACQGQGLDPDDILSRLTGTAAVSNPGSAKNWSDSSLSELCEHIVATHHSWLRIALPRLTDLIDKVVKAHGASRPELAELQHVFAELRGELEPHMFKEERILFPAIQQLEHSSSRPQFPFGTVANPIRVMEDDHDTVAAALQRIRMLTKGFQVPDDACNAWRAMLDDLRQLESDTHMHVHKENNILFRKAQQLEASRPEDHQVRSAS